MLFCSVTNPDHGIQDESHAVPAESPDRESNVAETMPARDFFEDGGHNSQYISYGIPYVLSNNQYGILFSDDENGE